MGDSSKKYSKTLIVSIFGMNKRAVKYKYLNILRDLSGFGHTFLTPTFEKPPFRLHIKRDNSLALLTQNFTEKIDFSG
jgi:hypothetical protein